MKTYDAGRSFITSVKDVNRNELNDPTVFSAITSDIIRSRSNISSTPRVILVLAENKVGAGVTIIYSVLIHYLGRSNMVNTQDRG